MQILDLLIRWLHVLAAVTWIGGNLIMAIVIVPYFKRSVTPVASIRILTRIGKQFEPIVWGCVLMLIFSGLFNVFRAVGGDAAAIGLFMRTLGIKLVLVLGLIILTGIHSFIMRPRMSQALEALEALEPDAQELPEDVGKMRSQMAFVSSAMGVVSLLVLLAAVALRMGI